MITVVEYNSEWVLKFKEEEDLLKNVLGPVAINIHHIGSTSVVGLHAKPIIDILIEVGDLGLLDAKNNGMQSLGYEVMGEFGIPGRRYFRKGANTRTHHVHCFMSGDPSLTRHLAFRDYLIAHPSIANDYAQLKLDIVKRCDNDMGKYCDEKDPFITIHEPKAVEWYLNQE